MDIKRYDRHSKRRAAALTAGVFLLLIGAATGAGMLVFSPSANAWPTSVFARWNPPAEEQEAGGWKLEVDGGKQIADEKEESLLAKLVGLLKDEVPAVEPGSLAGAALAVASEMPAEAEGVGGADEAGESAASGSAAGGEEDVVFQVTQQDVDQAIAAGEETIGFWRWLWNMVWGAMKSVAETVVSAVT